MKLKEDNDILKILQEELVQQFEDGRNEIRQEAREKIEKIQQENKRTFNRKRRKSEDYRVGDIIAIQRTQYGRAKLEPRFMGPYEIITVNGNDRYTVRKLSGEGPMHTTTSSDMMKRWRQDDGTSSSGSDEEQDGRVG